METAKEDAAVLLKYSPCCLETYFKSFFSVPAWCLRPHETFIILHFQERQWTQWNIEQFSKCKKPTTLLQIEMSWNSAICRFCRQNTTYSYFTSTGGENDPSILDRNSLYQVWNNSNSGKMKWEKWLNLSDCLLDLCLQSIFFQSLLWYLYLLCWKH